MLGLLDRWAARSRTGLWLRSLLSIYDLRGPAAVRRAVVDLRGLRPRRRLPRRPAGCPGLRVGVRSLDGLAVPARRVGDLRRARRAAGPRIVRPVLPGQRGRARRRARAGDRRAEQVLSEKPGFEGLDFRDYVAALDETEGTFDLIVVDGRARNACFHRAVSRLAPDGVLVFDNVDRERYREAIATLARPGRGRVDPRAHPGTALPDPDGAREAAWLSDVRCRPGCCPRCGRPSSSPWSCSRGSGCAVGSTRSATPLRATSASGVVGALALVLLGLARHRAALAAPDGLPGCAAAVARPGSRCSSSASSASTSPARSGRSAPRRRWPGGTPSRPGRRSPAGSSSSATTWSPGVVVGTLVVLLGGLDGPVAGLAVAARAGRLGGRAGRRPSSAALGRGSPAATWRIGWADTVLVLGLMSTHLDGVRRWRWCCSRPACPGTTSPRSAVPSPSSYAVGVVVVVAPAGVGAREAVFVLLLTPLTSVAAATALALLARVVHTAADGLMAAGWSVSRSCRTRRSRGWP